MAVAATTALRPTSLASPSASTDFTPRSKSSLRTTTLAYEQRVSVAKTIRASLPFSVIFNGWFESPSANIAWPAASTCATLAPPPGAMKNGTKVRSEEHTSELQSRLHLVCRLLLEKKKTSSVPNLQIACILIYPYAHPL